ncbi:MAG TPA: amidohydrolase family protein [Terrimesophilobacter sp.]|nr:amidohydrolase family protein [Terrimesophilobacter sp.]
MSLLLHDARLLGGRRADLRLSAGVITEIAPTLPFGASEVVDLDGRFVLPGLWDNHVHFTQHALAGQRMDVSAAVSAADVAGMIAATVGPAAMPGELIVGIGFHDGLWPDAPSREVLDTASGTVPIVVLSADLHSCWLNSAALARFGFPDHPTGLLREDDCFAVTARLQDVPDAVLDHWVTDAAAAAAARGVVGVVDFEMAQNLAAWPRRFAGGFDTLRVAAGIYTAHLEDAIADGARTGDTVDGTGGLLTVGPFKIIIDGSLNTRTARCVDPYPGITGDAANGILTVDAADLTRLMRRASAAGITPAVHAIGDEANRVALDAFESVGCTGRIEHAQLIRDADFARFHRLGVAASVQPEHAMDDRDVADRYWNGRTGRAFALRTLLNAGARMLFGSDAPVAPLDPWAAIAAAVSRSRDGRDPWHPEQRITVAEALSASANGDTVAVGSPADLAVVERDPLGESGERLRAMPVSGTLLAGRWTHRAF